MGEGGRGRGEDGGGRGEEGGGRRDKGKLDYSAFTLKDFFHSVVFFQQLNEDCCLSALNSMTIPFKYHNGKSSIIKADIH